MLSHPTAAITLADGEITVNAELLAPNLGLLDRVTTAS